MIRPYLAMQTVLLVIGMVSPALAQPEGDQAAVEQRIRQDLDSFVGYVNAASFLGVQYHVSGSRVGYFGSNEWLKTWHDYPRIIQLQNSQVEKVDLGEAVVLVNYRVVRKPDDPDNAKSKPLSERLRFRLGPGSPQVAGLGHQWYIVVGPPEEVWKKDVNSLERIALVMRQDKAFSSRVLSEIATWRLGKLALGLAELSQDYNECYAFDEAYFEDMITPYVPADKDILLVPGTRDRWSFNGRLCGHSGPWAGDPRCVLLYDGKNEKLNFRFDGKAAVCLDDRTVKFVTPDEAANLRFEPAPGR